MTWKGQYFPLNAGIFDVSFFEVEVQTQMFPRSLRFPEYGASRGILPDEALTVRDFVLKTKLMK